MLNSSQSRSLPIKQSGRQRRPTFLVANIGRMIGAAAVAVFAGAQAFTITQDPPEDTVCGVDAARPDHDTALHQEVAPTANGPIGYYRFGHGSPLVLITGYRATLSEWNAYFLAELAKRHEVIVFDNRGIGRSPSDIANYRVGDLADDTLALIKSLGFKSVSVLGWSMGGMIAQRLALDHPRLIDRLVLLSTEPPGSSSIPVPSGVEAILSGGANGGFDAVMGVLFPPGVVQRAEHCFAADMFKPHDYESSKVSLSVTAAQQRLLQDWRSDDRAFEQLRQLNVQTLVLTGMEDTVLDQRNSVILSGTIPHANLVKFTSGGHAMMYQYPRLLADQIDDWR